jgi:amino acid adenylation domain-containing protein
MNATPDTVESVEQKRLRLAALLQKKAAAPRTYPTTFNQQRLWFLDQLAPGGTGYNLNFVLRVRGPFDAGAMHRALSDIVGRHEALRTAIRSVNGTPVQVVEPHVTVEVPVESLEHLGDEARADEVQERCRAFVRQPFDLSRAPLLRARIWRESAESHVLCITVHHVISDGWSLSMFMSELKQAYAAFRRGLPAGIAPPKLQYSDFARWQREHMTGEEVDRQLVFWKKWMAGVPAVLDLQTDRPRPAVQDFEGASHGEVMGQEITDEVRAFARREGATPFMVLLAAFAALLTRWTGQDDIVVGTPIAGRARPELEGIFGYFANTLALRTDVSGDPTFRELVDRVKPMLLGAYAHQDLPFERLVDELQLERSLSHNPLFQVIFALQNVKHEQIALEDTEIEGLDADAGTTTFDLSFQVGEGVGHYGAMVEYKTGLFDASTIQRMVTHYRRLLDAVVADPTLRVSQIPLMDAEDEAAVLAFAAGEAAPFDTNRTLQSLVEAHAAGTPAAPALVADGATLTYAQVDVRANRLAHRLRALGVGPEVRVALAFERSAEMIVAVLAVLKAGGAYVPIDPRYPAERKAYLLEDSGAAVLVAQAEAAAGFPPHAVPVVVVDADPCPGEPETAPAPVGTPDNLAYLIYTSGSTGRPKGVAVTHRTAVHLVEAYDARVPMRPDDRTLFFASLSFDASVVEIFCTLGLGAALHVVPAESLLPGGPLEAVLRDGGITRSFLPPSALAVMREDDFPALRVLICGGEAVSADAVRRWSPGRTMVNAYGPTEVTVCCSLGLGETGERRPSIGGPLPNMATYVLDPGLRPVALGLPGEIVVGGAGVSRGYHGRPGLTAERFLPDPYAGVPGARMYRTGDRARWLADGVMDFLGRLDEQVKIRGFRIELGEIEAVLRAHPAVGDVVVLVREDVPGDRRIVAYVAPAAGADAPTPAELRAHALERMPEYMVPSAAVVLDAIPVTAHGKVDRRALPAPADAGGQGQAEHVEPRTPTEERVAAIWREVLNVGRVGATDSFFALGGHSLLATQIVARIAAELKVDLPIRAIFEDPTVGGMAARCDALAAAPAAEAAPRAGITRVSRQARTVDLSALEE